VRPNTADSPDLASFDLDLVTHVAEELAARLALRACRFEPFPFDALLPRIEPGRIVIPAAEPVARSYAEWQPAQGVELPVRYGSLILGRFVLVPNATTCGIAIPPADRATAISLARTAGVALGRRWSHNNPRVSAEREAPSWPTCCS
jgi:ABC-type amino acid transport substrate-binding protein